MSGALLVLNAGSSSIKFALFPANDEPARGALLCKGQCDGLGHGPGHRAQLIAKDGAGTVLLQKHLSEDARHETALTELLAWLEAHFRDHHLAAAGHRMVHGGLHYAAPVLIDETVTAILHRLIPLAPLHQPHNLAAVAALAKLHPKLPQVACFDTAFHRTQPELAATFALPRHLSEDGVRRYGFHGLSYEYVASILPNALGPAAANGRVVVAHLGNGASMCAMRGRRSVATTMGFTALDGLPMGQRCGALDPGVVLYLMQEKGMTADAVSNLLYHDSGLKGVSGISNDMRVLLASEDPHAKAAIDLFVYRVGRELGSLAAALGGLDALIFTAGIGEHAAEIRRRVCAGAAWLGIQLDEAANRRHGPRISTDDSPASAWVFPTDEDLMIARHTFELVFKSPQDSLLSGKPSDQRRKEL